MARYSFVFPCPRSLFLLGNTLLALVHPSITSDTSPPLSEASAKAIFENGNHRNKPNFSPNLVKIASAPAQPLPSSSAAAPRIHFIERPKVAKSLVNPPGVPDAGPIAVSINRTIPLGRVLGEKVDGSTSDANFTLEERQCQYAYCCPDPRYLNENTAYPWSSMGLWQWDKGSCSGTLVGPRHVLSAAHCVDWGTGSGALGGPIYYLPNYWPGHSTGTYSVIDMVSYQGQTPKSEPVNNNQDSFDYVVAILNAEPNQGWVGSKTYSTSWNGLTAWFQSGYAGNAGGGIIPYAQNNFKVLNEDGEANGGELLEYTMCAGPGDSGSSAFGWWSDGPYLVGTQTKGSGTEVFGPAGANMVDLINTALAQWP